MSSPQLGQITSQKQVLQQRLILTQELQLFLKLIQMTTLELKDYLEEQLIENPTLEESEERTDSDSSDDIDLSKIAEQNGIGDDNGDMPHYSSSRELIDNSEDDNLWENRVTSAETLIDHLRWQLKISDLTEQEKSIANIIVGNTNEDGYLESDIHDIAQQVIMETLERTNAEINGNSIEVDDNTLSRINTVLHRLQTTLDPLAVCSRDLKECLMIQAVDLGYSEDTTVYRLINDHLDSICDNEHDELAALLGTNIEDISESLAVISSLEPKPGRPFFKKDSERYIVPDFYVFKVGNEFQVQLNREFPRVRISNYYRNLIKKEKTLPPEAKVFIKEKLEAAQRILKCLEEREAAVKKIISKIVEVQKDFFEHGRNYIKPLILKDIADEVGVHESTVSRITSRRYIQTPQGTIELKSLFSRKIETSHGKEMSFERVKSIIKEIVSGEMPQSPYSDEDISKILERRNIKVARRTVAKYRKILKIPSSSARAKQKRGMKNDDNSNH